MKVFLLRNATECGPYSSDELLTMLEAGQVLATDLAREEGPSDWVELRRLLKIDSSREIMTPGFSPTAVVSPPRRGQTVPGDFETLREIARWQMGCNIVFLVSLLNFAAANVHPLRFPFSVSLMLAVCWGTAIFRLAKALRRNAWLCVVLSLIPLLGLVVTGWLVYLASAAIDDNGYRVGILGDLEKNSPNPEVASVP